MECRITSIQKKTHSHPWQTQKLKYTLTNFCESLGKEKTQEQIDAAFETWQSVCGLKFKRVESEDCEIKVLFLNDQINYPYKLTGQKGGTLAHAFYPGEGSICGDIHFDNEVWTDKNEVGKYNLFTVPVHEIGHCIGLFHNTEDKDSVMQPIYKPGVSVENKNKILSESDKQTTQEMHGAAKKVMVTAIFNSKQAKVMIRKILQGSKTKKVKIIYTLKPKHFSENLEISDESFQTLLQKLAKLDHAEFVVENFGVGDNA